MLEQFLSKLCLNSLSANFPQFSDTFQLRVLRGVKDANPRDPAIIWPNWGRGNPGLIDALEDYTAPPDPLCLNYDEY